MITIIGGGGINAAPTFTNSVSEYHLSLLLFGEKMVPQSFHSASCVHFLQRGHLVLMISALLSLPDFSPSYLGDI